MKIKNIIKNAERIPDNALVFLDYKDLLEIITRKRLELIDLIARNNLSSLKELTKLTKRSKQAINRDLRILERHEILKFEKEGKNIIPRLNKEIFLFQVKNLSNVNESKKHEEAKV